MVKNALHLLFNTNKVLRQFFLLLYKEFCFFQLRFYLSHLYSADMVWYIWTCPCSFKDGLFHSTNNKL